MTVKSRRSHGLDSSSGFENMIEVSTRQDRANFYGSSTWRKLRQEVLERDHYECQWCKDEGKVVSINDTILEVDHIKELEHYPELATDMDNLRVL
jgi:5-methylcytosine-specific restriction endonuclease McrA